MITTVTRSGPSASTATHATSVESTPPERPSTTCSKPFFVDVVARAEHERAVDLGVGVEQLGELAARARAAGRAPCTPARRGGARRAWPRAQRGAGGCRAAARPPRRRGRPSANSRCSANCGAARDDAPRRGRRRTSGRRRSARPGRRPCAQNATAARLSAARWAIIRSRAVALARVVGRRRDVDDERRARERLVGRRAARAARCPRRPSGRP